MPPTCDALVAQREAPDLQVKRIHEYKRQLLNVLGIIPRYAAIKNMAPEQRTTVRPDR